MKQFFLLLLILSCSLCIHAQSSRYSVFSVSGKVKVKQGATWKDAANRMQLGAFDELSIPQKASIKILESKTNSIYKSSGSGSMQVRQLVKAAKEQSERSCSALTSSFTESMGTKIDNNNRLRVTGAAHRGSRSGPSFEDSICSTIAYQANGVLLSKQHFDGAAVEGRRIRKGETYTLMLNNKSDLAYCVNVVAVNKAAKTCRLLLLPGYESNRPFIILNAHTKANIGDAEYLNSPDERLFVFASDRYFDNEEVNAALEYFVLDEGEDLFKMQYSDIK